MGWVLVIAALVAFPFLFPEEFLYWSRHIRRWLQAHSDRERRAYRRHRAQELARLAHQCQQLSQETASWLRRARALGVSMGHARALKQQLQTLARRLADARTNTGAEPFDPAPDATE